MGGLSQQPTQTMPILRPHLFWLSRSPLLNSLRVFVVFQSSFLLQELTVLTERLSRINEDLARKMQARNEFDQTIQETEAAYMKVRPPKNEKNQLARGSSSPTNPIVTTYIGSPDHGTRPLASFH